MKGDLRMDRRVAAFAAGFCALLLVASAAAAEPVMEPREVVKEYTGPGVVNWDWPTGNGGGTVQGNGIRVHTRRAESSVTMSVSDVTGQPVGAYIRQDRPNRERDLFRRFCGSTNKPVRITGGDAVWVYVVSCTDPGIAVSGKVIATFTR